MRRVVDSSRRGSPERRPSSAKLTASSAWRDRQGPAKIIIVPDEPEPKRAELPARGESIHVNIQEGERVHAGEPLMDSPAIRMTSCPYRREGAAVVPGERDPGGVPAAGREHQ